MSDNTDVTPGDDSGLSRRALIKRAAIVGGVVAWTAPTIQVLGQGTAWAAKAKKLPPGSVTICGDTKAKPGRIRYTWLGDTNAGGSCTDHSVGTCGTKCDCEDFPTQGTYSCGDGTVVITVTGGVIDSASVDPAGGYISPTQVTGTAGNLSFDMSVTNNTQTFTITNDGTECQYSEFHVSCSATPPVQPGYQLGGLELFDWSLT